MLNVFALSDLFLNVFRKKISGNILTVSQFWIKYSFRGFLEIQESDEDEKILAILKITYQENKITWKLGF